MAMLMVPSHSLLRDGLRNMLEIHTETPSRDCQGQHGVVRRTLGHYSQVGQEFETLFCLSEKNMANGDTRAARSVKCLTPDFGAGHDLTGL